MSEYPVNPSKRQIERQQAIAKVISGMAYRSEGVQMKIDFVQEPQLPFEPVVLERTDESQRGFNYATFIESIGDLDG